MTASISELLTELQALLQQEAGLLASDQDLASLPEIGAQKLVLMQQLTTLLQNTDYDRKQLERLEYCYRQHAQNNIGYTVRSRVTDKALATVFGSPEGEIYSKYGTLKG